MSNLGGSDIKSPQTVSAIAIRWSAWVRKGAEWSLAGPSIVRVSPSISIRAPIAMSASARASVRSLSLLARR